MWLLFTQAIFGTFGSFAMAPKADLDVLLLKGVGAAYDAKNNIYYTACNATGLPNINLKLGEAPTTRFVSIRPKDYLTPVGGQTSKSLPHLYDTLRFEIYDGSLMSTSTVICHRELIIYYS